MQRQEPRGGLARIGDQLIQNGATQLTATAVEQRAVKLHPAFPRDAGGGQPTYRVPCFPPLKAHQDIHGVLQPPAMTNPQATLTDFDIIQQWRLTQERPDEGRITRPADGFRGGISKLWDCQCTDRKACRTRVESGLQ